MTFDWRGDRFDRADFWEVLSQAHAKSEHFKRRASVAWLVRELLYYRLLRVEIHSNDVRFGRVS